MDHIEDYIGNSNIDFSCVIPVYNEQDCLYENAKKIIQVCDRLNISYEIIISDDGSTDNTPKIARKLQEEYSQIKYLRDKINKGRGEVVMQGFKICKGNIIAFMDIDLATDLEYLPMLIESIKKGSDVATGSRWLNNSKVCRTLDRKITSYVYNSLVRFLFDSSIKDHQCGFKAAKKEVILDLSKEMGERTDRSWAWDTEVLICAQKKGYRVHEFPIEWKNGMDSKFNYFKDIPKVFLYLLKLKFKIRQK